MTLPSPDEIRRLRAELDTKLREETESHTLSRAAELETRRRLLTEFLQRARELGIKPERFRGANLLIPFWQVEGTTPGLTGSSEALVSVEGFEVGLHAEGRLIVSGPPLRCTTRVQRAEPEMTRALFRRQRQKSVKHSDGTETPQWRHIDHEPKTHPLKTARLAIVRFDSRDRAPGAEWADEVLLSFDPDDLAQLLTDALITLSA